MSALVLWCCLQAAGPKVSIQAGETVFHPGRPMPLRVTVENAGAADLVQSEPGDWVEGLEVRDLSDAVVKAAGKTAPSDRPARTLRPGEFFGLTVDVSSALSIPADKEGWYRLTWTLGGTVSNEVRVLVVRDYTATIVTSLGEIEIEFLPAVAFNHVRNFLALARSGFYEGSIFHRVIPGFMMQGGKPKDPEAEPKTSLKAEFSDVKHVFGTVSMARTNDPNSAKTQFFICFGAAPELDRKYTAFGQLVRGIEVVKAVEKAKSDHSPCKCGQANARAGGTPCCGNHHEDRPETDIVIKKVVVNERKK